MNAVERSSSVSQICRTAPSSCASSTFNDSRLRKNTFKYHRAPRRSTFSRVESNDDGMTNQNERERGRMRIPGAAERTRWITIVLIPFHCSFAAWDITLTGYNYVIVIVSSHTSALNARQPHVPPQTAPTPLSCVGFSILSLSLSLG